MPRVSCWGLRWTTPPRSSREQARFGSSIIPRAETRKTWSANRKQNATSHLPSTSAITRSSRWHGCGSNSRGLRISAVGETIIVPPKYSNLTVIIGQTGPVGKNPPLRSNPLLLVNELEIFDVFPLHGLTGEIAFAMVLFGSEARDRPVCAWRVHCA